jgi:hypothetical protein
MQTKQIALTNPYLQTENRSFEYSLKQIAATLFSRAVISKVNFDYLPKAVVRLFKSILMCAISQDGSNLRFANRLNEDPELILEAVRHFCFDCCSYVEPSRVPIPTDSYFKYAGLKARRDSELIKKVVTIDQPALKYLLLEGQEFYEILQFIHEQRHNRP